MFISCIIPMYNEEDNVRLVVMQTDAAMRSYGEPYEILCVNDGSSDGTQREIDRAREDFPAVVKVTYAENRGMGHAIKKGIAAAKGDVIVTLDADQTFDPADTPKLLSYLPAYDLVIGSPYIDGGHMTGVPFYRKLISKLGNYVLSWAIPYDVKSTTTVFRAYNRELLDAIDIESDRMEINPEILAKAGALGYRIKEIPVTLSTRKHGASKFHFISGAKGHFWLSAYEKPFLIFGFFGLLLLLFGLVSGLFIVKEFIEGTLDPTRPLINLTVLFVVSGMIILLFGFVSNQVLQIKRELLKVRRDLKRVRELQRHNPGKDE